MGDGSGEVSLWKYPSLEKCASLKVHKEPILALQLSPDNKTLGTVFGWLIILRASSIPIFSYFLGKFLFFPIFSYFFKENSYFFPIF